MTVVVLYFAALRELCGRAEERFDMPEQGSTVALLRGLLLERHPALGPHLGSVRFAVNESFVDVAARLAPGDTVALIPPVSGG